MELRCMRMELRSLRYEPRCLRYEPRCIHINISDRGVHRENRSYTLPLFYKKACKDSPECRKFAS